MNFIWFIIIGLVSGFVAGKLMRGGGFGLVVNLIKVNNKSTILHSLFMPSHNNLVYYGLTFGIV